ncbi:MAG TPA: SPFH domain-containing protein [Phycisphaerales bacterium]|nr:SPFH domain-containing protein [Phycisphaerales bacterium]HMP38378.1 SPFH domain-containing protein [Phycisphaerales bacterium]
MTTDPNALPEPGSDLGPERGSAARKRDGGRTQPLSGGYAIEGEEAEPAAPRRAASAQLVVDRSPAAEATLRDAMDPANQSLAEALRLSYRVLQVVILALVVLFLLSGFQSVQEGFTGVRTLFGRIVGAPGTQQLSPGIIPFWPYPAGEIVTIPARRSVDVERAFWPMLRRTQTTIDQAVAEASESEALSPGGDGSILTAEGDIAHLRIAADFVIDDVADFLRQIEPAQADRVVQRLLQRAAIHTAAGMSTQEFVDSREGPTLAIRETAQESLVQIGSGLSLVDVRVPFRSLPLIVRREVPQVQSAREEARARIEEAIQRRDELLTGIAGGQYELLERLIGEYEQALSGGDGGRDGEAAKESLAALVAALDSPATSGEVARIIGRARAYQSQIDATIGNDFRRFESLLPAFTSNPRLIATELWLDAYADVMRQPLLEVVSVPMEVGVLRIAARSSAELMQARRRAELDRRKREADAEALMGGAWLQWGRDTPRIGTAGRRLERDAETGFGRGGSR